MTKIRYPLKSMLSLLENAVLVEKVLSLLGNYVSLDFVVSGNICKIATQICKLIRSENTS